MRIVGCEILHCNAGWRDFSFLKLINSIRGGQVMNVIQNDIELKGRNVNVSQHLQKV